jgi:hypothetical protein
MQTESAREIDENFDAFMAALPSLVKAHAGEFALIHQREIKGFFQTSLSATLQGLREFGAGAFSVQEVAEQPEHLGFYSYVGGTGDY